jgi:hypothetical protein
MQTLPRSLAVFILLLVATGARADYPPLSLTELFGGSELIVRGEIVRVGDEAFTLQPTAVHAGLVPDGPLQVEKYRDWTGGRRWSAYRTGQDLLLFLEESSPDGETGGQWKIRGLGGEGEMPIEEGTIYPHGLNIDGFERGVYEVDGGELYGYRFDVETFLSALTGYLRCFDAELGPAAGGRTEECTSDEMAAFETTSPLHRHLVSPPSD